MRLDEYFGESGTKEGYLNFFNEYANEMTPQRYARFTIRKLANPNSSLFGILEDDVKLKDDQLDRLSNLISTPDADFEVLCDILTPKQFEYIGW